MSYLSFEKNTKGRDFFVGDIHGCFYKLEGAMNKADFDSSKDRIFAAGDLVDRGTGSHEALDWLTRPYFHTVKGNHEDMASQYTGGKISEFAYSYNGGDWFLYLTREKQLEFCFMFESLPRAIEVDTDYGKIGVIHAEVFNHNWTEMKSRIDEYGVKQTALWARAKFKENDHTRVSGIDFVVVGHTPVESVLQLGNVFYIDTGAVFNRELTFVTLEELILTKEKE